MNITNNTMSSCNYFLNGLRYDRKKIHYHFAFFHKFTSQKMHKAFLKGGEGDEGRERNVRMI